LEEYDTSGWRLVMTPPNLWVRTTIRGAIGGIAETISRGLDKIISTFPESSHWIHGFAAAADYVANFFVLLVAFTVLAVVLETLGRVARMVVHATDALLAITRDGGRRVLVIGLRKMADQMRHWAQRLRASSTEPLAKNNRMSPLPHKRSRRRK